MASKCNSKTYITYTTYTTYTYNVNIYYIYVCI